MNLPVSVDSQTYQQWIAENLDKDHIREKLHSLGLDAESIAQHLKEFTKLKNARRQFKGFICLGLGAFMGFISCVLTLVNPIPELYNWILFGLTSVAIMIIMLGLYFLFE
jgi:hypothetical protein